MTDETTNQFLGRREIELRSRIAALHGQLIPLEAELIQVQKMRSLLDDQEKPATNALASAAARTIAGGAAVNALAGGHMPKAQASGAAVNALAGGYVNPRETIAGAAASAFAGGENPYATRTIKDLVIQALIDGFREGATSKELRDFILSGYHRAIGADTLRTQLHRLKASGILGRDASTDTWNFRDGKRSLYAMYDHRTHTRKAA